jgi:hypothetical protein
MRSPSATSAILMLGPIISLIKCLTATQGGKDDGSITLMSTAGESITHNTCFAND